MEFNNQSVLVEHSYDGKVFANSGCLIDNKFVLITSNILTSLITKENSHKTLATLTAGLSSPLELFSNPPKVTVVIRNEGSERHQYKEGKVVAAFVSDQIRRNVIKYLYDWCIDVDSNDLQLKQALSLFFIIEIDPREDSPTTLKDVTNSLRNLCLHSKRLHLEVGDSICVESTPFGVRHFLACHSRGIISNVLGERGSFLLTDVPTAPGSEGSPVFAKSSSRNVPIGIVLSSLSWYKGEWIGLTLVASFQAIFEDILGCAEVETSKNSRVNSELTPVIESLRRSIVQVTSGLYWGTAVLLDKELGIFITNSHVVEDQNPILHWRDVQIPTKILFKNEEKQVFDIAILQADRKALKATDMSSVKISSKGLNIGDRVFALGFPLFPRPTKPTPTITGGHVSHVSKSMLKTTCSVLPGASGGGILRTDGSLVGIIVCNARLEEHSTVYPRINMAVPTSAIYTVIVDFLRKKDINILRKLKSDEIDLIKEWNFLSAKL